MITSEMKNTLLQEQLMAELAELKKAVYLLEKEIEDIRLVLNRRLQ